MSSAGANGKNACFIGVLLVRGRKISCFNHLLGLSGGATPPRPPAATPLVEFESVQIV